MHREDKQLEDMAANEAQEDADRESFGWQRLKIEFNC